MNEGLEYTYNGIYGKVDGVTGKIYSYRYNWDENVEFESPTNAMSKEEAYKAYSNKDKWYGITYREDKEEVQKAIADLCAQGLYDGI